MSAMKRCLSVLALLGAHFSYAIYVVNNETALRKIEDNPAIWTEEGIWGPLLEEWALSGSRREKRVMKLIPVSEALVTEEPVVQVKNEKESKISPGPGGIPGKITNGGVSRPPMRQVSDTDLYLLGAIEKLVYRVDFMEKRLRRVEEMLYYAMAGNRVDTEACPENYTRAGKGCYLFSSAAGREYDWKVASKQCKRLGGALAELETIEENQDVIAHLQSNQHLRGKDYWTGGLNPGLLWIWSNTARPVGSNSSTILGEGRCLRLAYNPAIRSYAYKGTDCSIRYSYICELPNTTSSNEIQRLGKSKQIFN